MAPEIVLDLSRLLSRVFHPTPTGIDRVEMAYAEGLLSIYGADLQFAAVHRGRFYGRISHATVVSFLAFTAERWASGRKESKAQRWRTGIYWMARMRLYPVPRKTRARVLVQASPHHLDRGDLVRRILQREGASWVVLVHDLIPITHPEFARPGGSERHRRRIQTIARNAAAIVTNSDATARQLEPFLSAPPPVVRAAHLGTFIAPPATAKMALAKDDRPYFLVVGTIEPRKNHLLLLNLWRRMVEDRGHASVPQLVLVGRRGWENENVVDMLERSVLLRECVIELKQVSDGDLRALLNGCRALLMPSFAEGFGMPLTEALQAGTPAIVSDLPAMREIGQGVPDYLDPTDGVGWMRAILEYTERDSAAREAQLGRLRAWCAPTWRAHLDVVCQLVDQVER